MQKLKADTEAKLANAAAYAEDAATRWVAQGEAEIQKVYQKFEHWFATGQERSQEWFTTHSRIITAIFGVVAAFALQLDTIEIYKLVSSNREVRASLVAQVKPVLDQGEKILKASPTVLEQTLHSLGETASATNAASKHSAVLTNLPVAATDTPEKVKAKIRAALTNATPAEVDQALEDFDQATVKEVQARMKISSEEWTDLKKSLDQSGFELFPSDGWRWSHEKGTPFEVFIRHFLGMVFSALLLSLGAPFWFNALKTMASLRSSVAKNISEENKGEQSKGERKNAPTDQAAKLPPTVT